MGLTPLTSKSFQTRVRSELARLLKRDWRFFLWTSWFLVLGIGIGLTFPRENPIMIHFIQQQLQQMKNLQDWYGKASLFGKIALVWGNNSLASAFALISGIILIIPPVFHLIINGMLLGVVQKMLVIKEGTAPILFYLTILPHGIFELPAFIMACALGIRFGSIPWRLLYCYVRGNRSPRLFRDFFSDLRYYSVLIFLMLLVAAILEVTVSPLVGKMLGMKVISMGR